MRRALTTVSERPSLYGDLRSWALIEADAFKLLPELPAASVDAVVTDPPYGIGLKGQAWDGGRLTNGETFERWTASWASECLRILKPGGYLAAFGAPRTTHRLVAGIEDAGFEIRDQLLWLFGSGVPKSQRLPGGRAAALKPAYEPILLARRPFAGTLQRNVAAHGTGALNIDATRIGDDRFWPANITLTHHTTCLAEHCSDACPLPLIDRLDSKRPPSRLFYCAKADARERDAGCEHLPAREVQLYDRPTPKPARRNTHPTVKPLRLMRWIVRLVSPSTGVVFDPFAGSASTGAASVLESRQFVGVEREPEYVTIGRARLARWATKGGAADGSPP
jgi:DNA modification methylase